MDRKRNTLVVIMASTVLSLMIYVGSYWLLLDPSPPIVLEKGYFEYRVAKYRCGGESIEAIFWPLLAADECIRPKFWLDLTEKGKRMAGQ